MMHKLGVGALLVGCGSVAVRHDAPSGDDAQTDSQQADAPAGPCSKPFNTPTALGGLPYLTSTDIHGATLSPDERTIYFSDVGSGNWDLFTATRNTKVDAFANLMPLTNLSGTTFTE